MKIFSDKDLLRAGLVGGTLSRAAGCMATPQAQEPVYRQLGIPPENILHFKQTHSTRIIEIASPQDAADFLKLPVQEADAWLFAPAPRGWGAAILTADCVPLFLWTASGSAFALAHCGWRGVADELPFLTARALTERAHGETVYAYAGPHIQSCCFEVQQDCAARFAPEHVLHRGGKMFVDLSAALRAQLMRAGLAGEHIRTPDYCTCGDAENFFSWRRDRLRNRLLSFMYKP